MRWAHLIFGLLLFVVFTITGRYMRIDFPDKDAMDQSLRILMRSRHIYILFSALIHIALGIYMTLRPRLWQKAAQIGGSAILFLSSFLLLWAWRFETYTTGEFSDISREGLYLSLGGVILHLAGGIWKAKPGPGPLE